MRNDDNILPRLERLETLIELIRGGGGPTTFGASSVVWRPGVVSAGNVFATWPEVVAAVSKMQGAVTIGLDTDFGAANITAGNYDLRPVGVSGPVSFVNASKILPFNTPFFSLVGAVTIKGLTDLDDVSVVNGSTVPVIASAINGSFHLFGNAEIFQNPGAAAFIAITGGAFKIFMEDFSQIASLGGTNTITVLAPGTLALELNDNSLLDNNMLVAASPLATISVGFGANFNSQAGAPAPGGTPFKISQRGSAAIVAGTGKTAAIPAFISANTIILVSLKTPVGDALTVKYASLSADRTAGAPGSFQISALTNAGGGAVNGADTSTVDWETVNN